MYCQELSEDALDWAFLGGVQSEEGGAGGWEDEAVALTPQAVAEEEGKAAA